MFKLGWPTRLVIAFVAGVGLTGCRSEPMHASPGALPTGEVTGVQPKLNASTYFAHGHLLERQGNFEAAARQYRKALELSPDFLSARNRLGITLNKLGRHSEATAQFRYALRQKPTAAYLYNNLGFSLYLEGNYAEARSVLERALELEPDYTRARMNYAVVLAKQGEYEEALTQFTLASNEADAHYNLGVIQTELGDYAAAARSLEAALKLNPRMEPARQQLHVVARLAAEAEEQPAQVAESSETSMPRAEEAPPADVPVAQASPPPAEPAPQVERRPKRRFSRGAWPLLARLRSGRGDERASNRRVRSAGDMRLEVPSELSSRLQALLAAAEEGRQDEYQRLKQELEQALQTRLKTP